METFLFQQDYEVNNTVIITPKGHDFDMFVTPRFRNHYKLNEYEPFTSSLLINKLIDSEIFIDIGAHYGYYSLLVAKHYPNLPIISYEPVPENFKILQKNITTNQFTNILAVNKAVANFTGETEMNKTLASDNCSFFSHPACSTLEKITVQTISLNDLLQESQYKKVTIKIDVEGIEFDILQNARELLANNDNISLFVEFNPNCLLAAGHAPDELLELFASIDFELFAIDDMAKVFYRIDNLKDWKAYLPDESGYLNLYCVKKNRVKNILFFSHSSSIGGAEFSLQELVRELTHYYDCLCSVLMPGKGPQTDLLMKQGVATISAPLNWWCQLEKLSVKEINKRYLETYSWITEHIGQIEKIQPDIIVTNTIVVPWGAVVANQLSIPHIWFIHEFGQQDHRLIFYQPWKEVHDFIINHSDRILTCSSAIQKELFPEQQDCIDVIYYHIERSKENNKFKNATALYQSDTSIHLLTLSAINPTKGQEDAVKATIKLVNQDALDIELVMMGYIDQQYKVYLDSIIKENHASSFIHICEFNEDIQNALDQADIFLLCSRKEGLGRVTIEAMLEQIPVIGTNSGGTPEIIEDNQTGLLYSPGDFIELSEKIKYLVQNPDIASELAKNGKNSALSRFTIENYGGKVDRAFQEILEKNIDKPSSSLSNNMLNRLLIEDLKARYSVSVDESARLTQEKANAEQIVQKLDGDLAERDQIVKKLTGDLAERNKNAEKLNGELAEQVQSLQRLTTDVVERDLTIKGLRDSLTANQNELLLYLQSTSWKITSPLRKLSSLLRAVKQKFRRA